MTINKTKIAIVGCGSVGSAIAFSLLTQGICDVLLIVDLNEEKAYGEVFDLNNCIEYLDRNTKVMYGTYADCADADIIVIAAGPQQKAEDKADNLQSSMNLIKFIVEPIMASGFNGIFVNISNPVDAISQYIYELSGLPKNQVVGIGTSLDSARLKTIVARLIGVDPRSVEAWCIGGHGLIQIVPWSMVSVGGKKIYDVISDNPELVGEEDLDELVQKKIGEGWEMIEKKGTTCYGLATAATGIIKAIINDENKVIPVSALLEGEYEENDVFCGVPGVINRKGVYSITEIHMSKSELIKFKKAVNAIRDHYSQMKNSMEK